MTTITERPYSYNFSTNEVRYIFMVDDPLTAGCAIEVELYYHAKGAAAALLHTLTPLTPNTDGTIYCDVKSYLKPVLKYQLPVVGGNAVEPVTDQLKYFYIRYRQIADAAPDPAWIDDVAETKVVLLGGVEQMKFKKNNFFATYLQLNKVFLTWQPSGRFVFLDQTHYLTFLLTYNSAIKVSIQVFYTDGTSVISTATYSNNAGDILFRVKAGATDLALHLLDPGKKIYYYEIQIIDENDDIVTNPYRFYIDYRPVYKYWDLLYFNSIGGLDAARIKGEVDWSIETNFDQVAHITFKDELETDRPQEQFSFANVVKKDLFKGDAGWYRTKLEQEAMIEMFLHPIYEIIDARWIRVMNLKKSHDLRNTKDKKWSFPVEWSYGYEDSVFTPKEAQLGTSVSSSCIPVTVGSANIPDVRVGHALTHFIFMMGTPPFIITNMVKPSWMSYTIGDNGMSLSGTPDATGSNIPVSFTVNNCGGHTVNFSGSINVIEGPSLTLQINSTAAGDGTRLQMFKIGSAIEAGDTFRITIYEHAVSVIAIAGDNGASIVTKLRNAINATTESEWNDQGQAPASGTAGFPPHATISTLPANDVKILIKLDEAHQATATAF